MVTRNKSLRKRLNVSTKKNKWKKGHSSDSNPKTNKFRVAARSGSGTFIRTQTPGK